jgi:hypothetical protein
METRSNPGIQKRSGEPDGLDGAVVGVHLRNATALRPRGTLLDTMSRPEKVIPRTFEQAVAELKRDPSQPVHARVDDLDLELRVVRSTKAHVGIGTRLAAIGPWEGGALRSRPDFPGAHVAAHCS